MTKLANNSGLAKNDAQWWPKWVDAYARSVDQVDASRIEISRESLISLLQRMRDSGKSAWVRLQVVRAVEFYQKSVLQISDPDLSDVRLTLEQRAAKERAEKQSSNRNSGHAGADLVDDKMLIGRIDPRAHHDAESSTLPSPLPALNDLPLLKAHPSIVTLLAD